MEIKWQQRGFLLCVTGYRGLIVCKKQFKQFMMSKQANIQLHNYTHTLVLHVY